MKFQKMDVYYEAHYSFELESYCVYECYRDMTATVYQSGYDIGEEAQDDANYLNSGKE